MQFFRMFNIPNYTRNVSLRLSQVLEEIGLNEKIVMKRRRCFLRDEIISKFAQQVLDNDISTYYFGSQTEGTTTLGLHSDVDCVSTINKFNVIQDWSEWEPGKHNLLMIQDDAVTSGYCLLQMLRRDAPLPVNRQTNQHTYRDSTGRILLKNTFIDYILRPGDVRNGPAQTRIQEDTSFVDIDMVYAFPGQKWRVQAKQLICQQCEGHWPTDDMKQYCEDTACFVVGVGKKGSINEQLEWRISTSLAERCLMFNLNMTQIRCYVLMKMIIKTFITTQFPDSISSFMCKTVLLHCISKTRRSVWKESNLLTCLTFCLSTLYNCVLNENCPHFFIPENNLMARQFSPERKQMLLARLSSVISSNGKALLEIKYDQLGLRIQNAYIDSEQIVYEHTSPFISGFIFTHFVWMLLETYKSILFWKTNQKVSMHLTLQTISKYISKLIHIYHMDQRQNKIAFTFAKFLSITLGSVLASIDICNQKTVKREALTWMSFGLDTDVASGKLKLASIFYCTGCIVKTEIILKNIEDSYDLNVVEPICSCYDFKESNRRRAFYELCYEENDEYTIMKYITASCVLFLQCEINCCPYELKHEMFRSTQQDLPYRDDHDEWMDCAVIDSLPYLYFLQFKAYTHLNSHEDKQRALFNLASCINTEPNLAHRDTALNLLGQCMEKENKFDAALVCYQLSLKLREKNNAAKLHICILLCSIIHNHKNKAAKSFQ